MPIFISYSHQDEAFATRLAAQLVKHKARVWIDRWELHVGDSIIDRLQAAIQGASALIVVLSKASVESEWCKKERSSGLVRELEERRVVVLPVVIEDCEIPLFLRGKLYADFRNDFDRGLRTILETVARVTSDTLGRIDEPEFHVDWAIDWGREGAFLGIRLTLIEQAADQPYSVLTEIRIVGNATATTRYEAFEAEAIDWVERAAIVEMLAEAVSSRDLRLILDDSFPKTQEIILRDPTLGTEYGVTVTSRRLGTDTGRDILLNLSGQILLIRDAIHASLRDPTPEERQIMERIRRATSGR